MLKLACVIVWQRVLVCFSKDLWFAKIHVKTFVGPKFSVRYSLSYFSILEIVISMNVINSVLLL